MMILDLSLDNNLYINNLFDAAMQEIDILFSTTNCELIGYPEFGTNFMEYLWTMTPTTNDLREYIQGKLLETSFVSKLKYFVDVQFLKDDITFESMYYVKITIYNDYDYAEKEIHLKESDYENL
jgi:hypothetical protein